MRSAITLCWLVAGWWLVAAEARHVQHKREGLDQLLHESPLHELEKPDPKFLVKDTSDEKPKIAIEGTDRTIDKDLPGKEVLVADKEIIEKKHKPEEKDDKLALGEEPNQGDLLVVESSKESGESSEVVALVAVFLVENPEGGGRRGRGLEESLKQLL